MFGHLINGRENKFNFEQKKSNFDLKINREKDRNAKLIIKMHGQSTFISDPKAPRKYKK